MKGVESNPTGMRKARGKSRRKTEGRVKSKRNKKGNGNQTRSAKRETLRAFCQTERIKSMRNNEGMGVKFKRDKEGSGIKSSGKMENQDREARSAKYFALPIAA